MESGGTTILDFALLHPGYEIHARANSPVGRIRQRRNPPNENDRQPQSFQLNCFVMNPPTYLTAFIQRARDFGCRNRCFFERPFSASEEYVNVGFSARFVG